MIAPRPLDARRNLAYVTRVATAHIPLEDNFGDILGKAQRGLKLSDTALASKAGVSETALQAIRAGKLDEPVLRALAKALGLGEDALLVSARQGWYPADAGPIDGLACFTTPYREMTVNSYLVFDPQTRAAAAFDTGADCSEMLDSIKKHGLKLELILITHIHSDHILKLDQLKKTTGASVFVSSREPMAGAEAFEDGREFRVGNLRIETRRTSGHSRGGVSFVVTGLARQLVIVGDAMFAGSMGGGLVSYNDALETNRTGILTLPDDTIICPGHGPLTTVGEEKLNNPFFFEVKEIIMKRIEAGRTGKPILRQFINLWTLAGYPTRATEWSLEKKLAVIKEAGFWGFTDACTTEHGKLARKHGLGVIGFFASSNPKHFARLLRENKDAGAHHINVHLGKHDTSTAEALGLTMRLLDEAAKLGVEVALEVHRDTCTETPEKTCALADAYQKVTGKLLPLTWDFSHPAVVKHLWPSDCYIPRLLTRPDLIRHSQQFHLRPFNGHHCQIPVTDGRGNLAPEFKDWLPFAEALLKMWLTGNRGTGREIFVCPEMGPLVPAGYRLSGMPCNWKDAQVLAGEIDRLWRKLNR